MKHVPPKHDRTAPRSWFSLFRAKGGIFAIIAAVICIGVTIGSVFQYRAAAEYARVGIEAQAEIIDRRVRSDSDGDDDYYLTFRFTAFTEDHVTITRERKVSRSRYNGAPVGSFETIRYLPRDPNRFETYVGKAEDDAVALRWIAGAAGAGGLIALWFVGDRVNRTVLTRKWGYRTVGRVEQVVETKNSGRPSGKGYLIWKTSDGARGESLMHPIGKLNEIGVGAEINVYVRKGHTVWEGDVGPARDAQSRVPNVPR